MDALSLYRCPNCKAGSEGCYQDSLGRLCCPFCLHRRYPARAKSATGFGPMEEYAALKPQWSRTVLREASLADYARVNRNKKGKEAPFPLSKRVLKLGQRDNWTCHLCGAPVYRAMLVGDGRGTADHLLPRSLGGTNALSNLKLAHKGCNTKRGNKLLTA
jgi:hypothetical protein